MSGFAADHQAVSALETEYAAARAAIHEVHASLGETLRANDVIAIVGVSSVDHDVAGGQLRKKRIERGVHHGRGHHQPDRARRREARDEIIELGRAGCAFLCERMHGRGGSYRAPRSCVRRA